MLTPERKAAIRYAVVKTAQEWGLALLLLTILLLLIWGGVR